MRFASSSRALAAAVILTLVPAAVPALAQEQPAPPQPPPVPGPPSLEGGSWTARMVAPTQARNAPGGRPVVKLRQYTPWSQRTAVLLVTDYAVVDGRGWVEVLVPGRPNGRQAWVPESNVSLKRTTTWVRVSTGKRTVEFFENGKVTKRLRAAVGTGGTPTPKGLSAVQDAVATGGQLGPFIVVLTSRSPVYKTFAGGNGEIGVHGWPSAAVLGKAVSHGCVRLSRTGVTKFVRAAPLGTPVEVV